MSFAGARTTIPLAKRPTDYFFIGFFAVACVIALVFDYINAVGDIGTFQRDETGKFVLVNGITPEKSSRWLWPPQICMRAFYFYCENVDPALQMNPAWMKYLAILSPLVFAPFYVFAIACIWQGLEIVRIPALIYSAVMISNLLLIFFEAVSGSLPSPNFGLFFAAYGAYLVVPIFIALRFASPHPFSHGLQPKTKVK